jgi:hypothetical protein
MKFGVPEAVSRQILHLKLTIPGTLVHLVHFSSLLRHKLYPFYY